MPYVPLPRFLVRAPLLPLPVFGGAARRLLRAPLGRLALELASPSLMARPDGASAARALDRYGRRAAFRTTPHGLLAGVTVGALGRGSRAATGRPRAHFDLAWARMAALGRALLDEGAVRAQVRLRRAPSLLRGPGHIFWLALDVPFGEERQAETDARLERILDASRDWAPWAALRAAARDGDESNRDGAPDDGSVGGAARADGAGRGDTDGVDDLDDLLLVLIDDGLLHCDLVPPLIGPPAAVWMAARLDDLHPRPAAAEILAEARGALEKGDLAQARGALKALPGGGAPGEPPGAPGSGDPGAAGEITAVLVHQPATAITLDRKTVQRAADLAPLLFRLQEALAPPAAERLADAGARAAIFAAGELFGDGALDLQSLALGEYGVDPGEESDADPPGPPPALLRLLVDAIAGARARGRRDARAEIALSPAALDAVLPAHAPPPTCELFLAPCRPARPSRSRARAGKPSAGAGWLLGLHAPAGATWGRFAAALGEPLDRALHGLAAAEAAAQPNEQRLDVAYAASAGLADLGVHPPYRASVLALSSWPAPGLEPAVPAAAVPRDVTAVITPADLELLAAGGAAVALRARGSRQMVVPSPLGRVRSDTAPTGAYRLLAGWSLYRQHAPWALTLGPLAELAQVPRITIDGFVVSPASWRVPNDALRAGGRRALRRWRREAGVPRYVQVGSEDQLLPVDLDHPTALDDVTGQPRAWEIWPPIERGRAIDRDGRRLEAVIALVDTPAAPRPPVDPKDPRSNAVVAAADDESVPPPRLRPAAAGWQTFKIFGTEARQDEVLLDAAAPALREGLAAGEIDDWFFIRYFDGPGHRPHLRVRARASGTAGANAFTARLQSWLRGARASGAVVDLEIAEYHPEVARFGGAASLAVAERIFQSDSQLACELIGLVREAQDSVDDPLDAPETVELLVAAFDALAAGMGLAIGDRHRLARRRRDAHAAFLPEANGEERRSIDADYRARARRLRIALGAPPPGQIARALGAHRERVSAAAVSLDPAARAELFPALLHLGAVRLAGPQREVEARAYLFWERTLEGLLRSGGGSGGPTR